MELEGKIALVTGGSRGIGKAIVNALSEKGVRVAFFYHSAEDRAREVASLVGALAVRCDVSAANSVREGVSMVKEKLGNIQILVNNAGVVGRNTKLLDTDEDDWDNVLSINLKGAYLVSREVVPQMIESREGKIVNISSIAGKNGGTVGVHYAASKSGLIGLTFALASELAKYNILVNAVAPGPVDTELLSDEVKKKLAELSMLKRIATPEEIAHTVLYLIENDYVTGEVVDVNGGRYMD